MAQAQDQVKKAQQAVESGARLQKLLAKRSSTIKTKAAAAAAAEQNAVQQLAEAEALQHKLLEEVGGMKGQKGSSLSTCEGQKQQQQLERQLAADLSEQERQLKDTRSRYARLKREAQEVSRL